MPLKTDISFVQNAASTNLPGSLYQRQYLGVGALPQNSTLDERKEDGVDKKDISTPKGFVTRTADLYTVTPIDPLFLLLPALAPQPASKSSEPTKKLFLSGDHYVERMTSISPDLNSFIRVESLRASFERRMAAVCDTVDAGVETMYRLNEEKLLQVLLQKARNIVDTGLPASVEDKLIRKALEVPMLSIKRDEIPSSEAVEEKSVVPGDSGGVTPTAETPDTQTTTESAATSFSEASTAATPFSEDTVSQTPITSLPPINAPEGVAALLRLQTALFFICSSYLAPHLSEILKKKLSSSSSPVDFGPLDKHLAHLTKLRQEALAARSLGDYSRKRSMNEDDEGLETRAEKKRKKDEEEKRKKAGESRGVRDLKKVNVSGMKKMSDFFKKK